MSGGSFDYAYSRVLQFAEELRAKIADNGKENDYGEKCEFSAQTIARLQSIVEDAERTAKLMKAAEWLYSGDTGENGFAASVTDVRRTAMIRAHAAFASAEAIREGRTNDQTSLMARRLDWNSAISFDQS